MFFSKDPKTNLLKHYDPLELYENLILHNTFVIDYLNNKCVTNPFKEATEPKEEVDHFKDDDDIEEKEEVDFYNDIDDWPWDPRNDY